MSLQAVPKKQTARKSTQGKPPRKQLAQKRRDDKEQAREVTGEEEDLVTNQMTSDQG